MMQGVFRFYLNSLSEKELGPGELVPVQVIPAFVIIIICLLLKQDYIGIRAFCPKGIFFVFTDLVHSRITTAPVLIDISFSNCREISFKQAAVLPRKWIACVSWIDQNKC